MEDAPMIQIIVEIKAWRGVCLAQGHSKNQGQDCKQDTGPLQPRACLLEPCSSCASAECQQCDRKLAGLPVPPHGPTGQPVLTEQSPLLSSSPCSQLWCHEDNLGFDVRQTRLHISLRHVPGTALNISGPVFPSEIWAVWTRKKSLFF